MGRGLSSSIRERLRSRAPAPPGRAGLGRPLSARYEPAAAAAKSVVELGDNLRDLGLRVTGGFFLGIARFGQGAYALAEDAFGTIVAALGGDRAHERFGLP